jgi:hypothetical protein
MLSAMSQPPPWETQPPPGWGPPQPPAQQPGAGGWNQGPYSPQQPPAGRFPDQYPLPGQQPYPPYGQNQYPPSPFPDGEPPRKRRNNGRTAGIVGTALLLVAGGTTVVVLATKHSGSGSSGGAPQAAPSVTAGATTTASGTMTFPDNSFPASGATSAGPAGGAPSAPGTPADSLPATDAPSAADPASLDSAATDKTPFTAAGLVASQFKDDKNVVYKLTAASTKPCDKVGDQAVATIVKSAKCTQFLAASWTDSSGRIIVSAMIVPYQDAATAKRISDKLGTTAHTGDYNQWCPPAGQPHADVCTKLTAAATREGKFGSFHRYVLITTAVYSDLRSDDAQKDWLVAAAGGAFQNTLPGM